jgi:hypothetical protein
MKVFQTKRLYFKKWLYKIETSTPGASMIKRWGIETTIQFCDDTSKQKVLSKNYSAAEKAHLKKFAVALLPFVKKEMQIRAEWNSLNFFLNDPTLYEEILQELKPWVTSVTKPASDEDAKMLSENQSFVLCTELPHKKFNYRVYIRHNMPAGNKRLFLEWLKNYNDSVLPSKGTQTWLNDNIGYFQDPFVYVTDHKLMLMVRLFLGHYARSTQEFVLKDTGK